MTYPSGKVMDTTAAFSGLFHHKSFVRTQTKQCPNALEVTHVGKDALLFSLQQYQHTHCSEFCRMHSDKPAEDGFEKVGALIHRRFNYLLHDVLRNNVPSALSVSPTNGAVL